MHFVFNVYIYGRADGQTGGWTGGRCMHMHIHNVRSYKYDVFDASVLLLEVLSNAFLL